MKTLAIFGEPKTKWISNLKVEVDSDSELSGSIILEKPQSGLKLIAGFSGPTKKSTHMGFQYKHDNIGCTTTFLKLMENPVIDFSGVRGFRDLYLGTDVSFNPTARDFTKYNFGCSLCMKNIIFSLNLNDKVDTLRASHYQRWPSRDTAIGVEIARSFSTHGTEISCGVECAWNEFTRLKGRCTLYGVYEAKVNAMIQHELLSETRVLVCGEIDTKDIGRWPKMGVALDLEFQMN